jgi:hypothetical protein
VSADDPVTYWERRQAGVYDRMAAERAAEREAADTPAAAVAPQDRDHVPIGGDVELQKAIDDSGGGTGGGPTSLTDLADVTGVPGIGKAPVSVSGGEFPLTHIVTQTDLDAVLATVAGVDWHDIGAPGEPQFLSGFRNIGDPWSPARYRLLANSTIRIQGTVCCDDATIQDATWIPIFQLPPEAAPANNLEFVTLTNDDAWSRVYVWASGEVIWAGYTGAPHAAVGRLPLNMLSWSTSGPAPSS